ncbi:TPA: hypothetical protein ACGORV_000264 [Streptococcus suis]|uniref:hypothetical protein n=1 Tax=Streptococcus suis TaxID=1307 RepID=UPI0021BBB70A|nr:hypothetical protein [Streptococcus suis]
MKKIQDMTQEEIDSINEEIKRKAPKLHQFILDFLDRKVTSEEVENFLALTKKEQWAYINNYQARCVHDRH